MWVTLVLTSDSELTVLYVIYSSSKKYLVIHGNIFLFPIFSFKSNYKIFPFHACTFYYINSRPINYIRRGIEKKIDYISELPAGCSEEILRLTCIVFAALVMPELFC